MHDTAPRLLRLLTLFQVRRQWTGAELASRLAIDVRTVRRDVGRLRRLGYQVTSFSGIGGTYQLAPGSELPPLMLDDQEAIAVAASLISSTQGEASTLEEPALRALAKLDGLLSPRLRRRLQALRAATVSLQRSDLPAVDAQVLVALAVAARDREVVSFTHEGRDGVSKRRTVEPVKLVRTHRVWYLLAWDRERSDWRTFRVDRVTRVRGSGETFVAREPPQDPGQFVSRAISSGPYRFQARILMHAPAERVRALVSPGSGQVEARDADTSVLHVGSDSLDQLALHVALKGLDFEILAPPELVGHVHALADRCRRAVEASGAR